MRHPVSSWLFVIYLPYCFLHTDLIDDVEKQEKVESKSQIWTKVKENAEGYFFLKNMRNPTSSELLIAVSKSDLKVVGNYTIDNI